MAQDSWPSPNHNARNITDAEYEALSARFSDDGVDGTPLGAPVVTAGTGLDVVIRANVRASLRGFHWTSGPVDLSLPIAANGGATNRTDSVVLRLDRSTWDVRAVVRQGTPGSGAPALVRSTGTTGVYEILLAYVVVRPGVSTVWVVDRPQYIGSRIRAADSGLAPPPMLGEVQYRPNLGTWNGWNGSEWMTIFEDTGMLSLGGGYSTWEPQSTSYGRKVNGVVSLRISVRRKESTFLASDTDGSKIATVPATLAPAKYYQFVAARFSGGAATCRVEVRPDGEVWARHLTHDVPAGRALETTLTYIQ